ncbi:TPA: hypothetical protein I9007_000695 [Clostridium perfringens]|uniref:hypothetical protein n=1 Tax=Clostridium perfringens TaxID=1502 RepID=UPI001A2ADBCB|nr:hypothetical protein [Clostridium perfringens]WFB43585.1 hypothetical protein P6X90_07350 [Clostridium perfringens]WFD75152.1 hypothetical protein P6978_07350 [Clostridium perfringens]HAT4185215.1 hypothetical protein [Clostridium perfringens]HAT4187789.1 hypothetical protein [Clostridium perfringens]HAT4194167.1 hypothetical protein [Clostridium perfringens]
MREYNKQMVKYILMSLILLIGSIVTILSIIWLTWGNNFKVNEWITFCATIITTLLGAYATIIAVLISINYTNKLEFKKKNEQKARLAKLIYIELNEYLLNIEEILTRGINGFINESRPYISGHFEISKIKMANENFKEWLYEFIILDDSRYGYVLLRFYNQFVKEEDFEKKLIYILSEEYFEIYNYTIIKFNDKFCEDPILVTKDQKEILREKESEIDFTMKFSEEIINTIIYLKKLLTMIKYGDE